MLNCSTIQLCPPAVKGIDDCEGSRKVCYTFLEEDWKFSTIFLAGPNPMRSQSWHCLVMGGGMVTTQYTQEDMLTVLLMISVV